MPSCKNCGAEIQWKQPYTQGDKPLNMDGTVHDCPARKKSSGGAPKFEKTPIDQSNQFMAKAMELSLEFCNKQGEQKPDYNTYCTMVTALFDTLSRSYKL